MHLLPEYKKGIKDYFKWMQKDLRRQQDWRAKVDEWIKRHNSGKARIRDGKSLIHIQHVEASTQSGRKAAILPFHVFLDVLQVSMLVEVFIASSYV